MQESVRQGGGGERVHPSRYLGANRAPRAQSSYVCACIYPIIPYLIGSYCRNPLKTRKFGAPPINNCWGLHHKSKPMQMGLPASTLLSGPFREQKRNKQRATVPNAKLGVLKKQKLTLPFLVPMVSTHRTYHVSKNLFLVGSARVSRGCTVLVQIGAPLAGRENHHNRCKRTLLDVTLLKHLKHHLHPDFAIKRREVLPNWLVLGQFKVKRGGLVLDFGLKIILYNWGGHGWT